MWAGKNVTIVGVHGYPPRTVDLRWTESGSWWPGPRAAESDEVSGHKRNVPVAELSERKS